MLTSNQTAELSNSDLYTGYNEYDPLLDSKVRFSFFFLLSFSFSFFFLLFDHILFPLNRRIVWFTMHHVFVRSFQFSSVFFDDGDHTHGGIHSVYHTPNSMLRNNDLTNFTILSFKTKALSTNT